jgi:hypothetical protein
METFAERQLKKFGWKEGDSLGKSANGLTRAILPEIKQDVLGIGSNSMNDCWWDHQYNKATSEINILVEDGSCTVKKTEVKCSESQIISGFLKSSGTVEKDFSIQISDEQLFEACGRRSCRKGARGVHSNSDDNTEPIESAAIKTAKKAAKKEAKKAAKKEAKKVAKKEAKKKRSIGKSSNTE